MRSPAGVVCTIELVCLSAGAGDLHVLLQRDGRHWHLPQAPWDAQTAIADGAMSIARAALNAPVRWYEQVAAFSRGTPRTGASLAIVFVSLVDHEMSPADGGSWCSVADASGRLSAAHRGAVDAACAHIRQRMDQAPVAFHLLPEAFTLGALQRVYEILLGRRLHKASFRRALHAERLVQPTEEWRTETRGRPAQFFRFAPRRRARGSRSPRFDLIGTP